MDPDLKQYFKDLARVTLRVGCGIVGAMVAIAVTFTIAQSMTKTDLDESYVVQSWMPVVMLGGFPLGFAAPSLWLKKDNS